VVDTAVSGGGSSADSGDGIAFAADGNRYVVGTFEGTATFGDVSVTSAGDSDIFLVKYDENLDAVWARRAGTDVFNDFGGAVAVGPDGSVYATGFFTGVATWDGGGNPDGELTTFSDFDAFLAKYTPNGDLEWVRQAGGVGQDTGRDVAVDAEGNAYLVGGFDGVGTFGSVTLETAGSSDAFLAKYDPDGEVVWAQRGGSDQGDLAYGVAVTPAGAAHVSGSFRGVALFGALPIQSAGATDVFVAQYDADGEPVWVEGIGADGSEFTRGGGIGLGPDGSVYVQGSFSNTILVGSDVLESLGFTDIFVAKLTADGDELWGRRGGGDGTNFSAALAVDASGNALTTGYVDGTGTFADEPITTQGRDGYLAVFDSAGDLVTVELLGGTGQDTGSGVSVSADRFALTGSFRGTASFADFDLTSAGSSDMFVLGGPGEVFVPSVLFVDADATGAETGLSWTDAFTDLQDALALAAQVRAGSLAIWVAEGTYYPTDDGDRSVSFELASGVALYGGFFGIETMINERDPEANRTVLSGDVGIPNEVEDNSYHVVFAEGVDAMTVLDGFTVTHGGAAGPASQGASGGGIYVLDSILRIANGRIRDNIAASQGGGVHCVNSSIIMENMTVQDNETMLEATASQPNRGGGAVSASGCSVLFDHIRFSGNTTVGFGGAVNARSSSLDITVSSFIGNRAESGGAIRAVSSEIHIGATVFSLNEAYSEGGAISDGATNLTLRHVRFIENRAGTSPQDGAISNGGALRSSSSDHSIAYTDFVRNSVIDSEPFAFGGAVSCQFVTANYYNVRFHGNKATAEPRGPQQEKSISAGGAIESIFSELLLVNSEFVGNAASGGTDAFGGAVRFSRGSGEFVNSYVGFNSASGAESRGGGLAVGLNTSVVVRNSIMWRNQSSEQPQIAGGALVANSVVEGGFNGSSVLDADPFIIRSPSPGADGEWGTVDDDYGDLRLQQGSPAVDFGLAEFLPPDTFDLDEDGDTEEPLPVDLDGGPRVLGSEVDLGPYESPFTVTVEPGAGVPTTSGLAAAYPNPFSRRTTLALDVAEAQDVTVDLFDVLGRRVATVHEGPLPVGTHRVVIEARGLPAGVYVVRADGEAFRFAQRVTLVR
jgi:hypothetical protein